MILHKYVLSMLRVYQTEKTNSALILVWLLTLIWAGNVLAVDDFMLTKLSAFIRSELKDADIEH